MTSFLYGSPSGVPGDITRQDFSRVEPANLVAPFPTNFGQPMKYAVGANGSGVTPMVAADVATAFAGILTRAVPGISQSSVNESFNTFQPNQSEPNGLCVSGYVSVLVNALGGTPVRGQPVFLVVTASAGHPAGTFETTANGGNNIPLTGTLVGNVTWAVDGVDSFFNAEVRINQ